MTGRKPNCKTFKPTDFKVGERIRLHWYGDKALGKNHSLSFATIVSINRKRLIVESDVDAYGVRAIDPNKHVWSVVREGVEILVWTATNDQES